MCSRANVAYSKYDSVDSLSDALCDRIVEIALTFIQSKHSFFFAVSGASMIKQLTSLPTMFESDPLLRGALEKGSVKVFLCDERKVPYDSADSTYGGYQSAWKGSKLLDHLIPIDPNLTLAECAADYETRLKAVVGESTQLDLVVLGIGPDGHTCSLFPSHPLLEVTELGLVSISDSPKPPPERVTLTLPSVKTASRKIVVAAGEPKSHVIKSVVESGVVSPVLPVSLIRSSPQDDSVQWMLDDAVCTGTAL